VTEKACEGQKLFLQGGDGEAGKKRLECKIFDLF
jgi:hypothetical protein